MAHDSHSCTVGCRIPEQPVRPSSSFSSLTKRTAQLSSRPSAFHRRTPRNPTAALDVQQQKDTALSTEAVLEKLIKATKFKSVGVVQQRCRLKASPYEHQMQAKSGGWVSLQSVVACHPHWCSTHVHHPRSSSFGRGGCTSLYSQVSGHKVSNLEKAFTSRVLQECIMGYITGHLQSLRAHRSLDVVCRLFPCREVVTNMSINLHVVLIG